jgi:hypothetical protein
LLNQPRKIAPFDTFNDLSCASYMLVPKRANYQYRYGAAQYRYWYPYSNSLVFTFLSAIFPKYDKIH